MHFRFEYLIDGLDDLGATGTVKFEYGTPHQITVSFHERESDGEKETICVVTSQQEPAAHVAEMFASLDRNLLPTGSMNPGEWKPSRFSSG